MGPEMARDRDERLTSPGVRTGLALVLDLLFVAVFTLIGRRTHDEPLDPAGWWDTAWPFLAGLAIGWVVVAASSQAWPTKWWHGLSVWIAAVFGGMAFRDMSGQGTALAFVIVATIFLGLTLVGWRVVLGLVDRRLPEAKRPTDAGRGRVRPPVEHTEVGDPLGLEELRGPEDDTRGRGVVPRADRERIASELEIRQPRSPEDS